MIRYTISFIFLNMYSSSLGNPLPPVAPYTLLNDSMVALSKRCENSFLSEQINSKLYNCSIVVPPYNENQFECLIFYDINTQLCDAIAAKRITVTGDDVEKLKAPIDVENLCAIAKTWNISEIVQYPLYKTTVTKVMSKHGTCSKVCGTDDITSEDANYFCKYYKWGSELLSQPASDAPSVLPSVSPLGENDLVISFHHPSAKTVLNTTLTVLQTKNESETVDSTKVLNSKPDVPSEMDGEVEIPLQMSSTSKQESGVPSETSYKNISNVPVPEVQHVKVLVQESPQTKIADPAIVTEKDSGKKIMVVKPPQLEETLKAPTQKDDGNIPNSNLKQPNAEIDDYQDSDEGKAGLTDMQGEDDDDNLLGDPDLKQETTQNKNPPRKIETSISSYNGEIELFPNTMQDAYPDSDDHFFPFFLTAVILVVLLYVLYHNKSKVSKVFLGLIVEGRQPGRRRNSRGHAYRRLDTLEQAMSASTAAAPSKIIY